MRYKCNPSRCLYCKFIYYCCYCRRSTSFRGSSCRTWRAGVPATTALYPCCCCYCYSMVPADFRCEFLSRPGQNAFYKELRRFFCFYASIVCLCCYTLTIVCLVCIPFQGAELGVEVHVRGRVGVELVLPAGAAVWPAPPRAHRALPGEATCAACCTLPDLSLSLCVLDVAAVYDPPFH